MRCECGVTFDATFKRPRAPRALRCSTCGGNLDDGTRHCSYCDAEVTIEERRLSAICPGCFARMNVDARFCMDCGIEIKPQAILALQEDRACPRCKAALRAREIATTTVIECTSCGGLWLDEHDFDAITEDADKQDLATRELQSRPPPPSADGHPVRYIPCVVCGELMMRRNYASISGVVIDVCRDHGIWLDHSELDKILRFIKEGGLDRARERKLDRLKEEQRRARRQAMPDMVVHDTRWSSGGAGSAVDGGLLSWVVERLTGF